MWGEAWENYETKDSQEFRSRGLVTSELETPDKGLEKVEEVLGFSPDEAFDSFKQESFTGEDYQTRAAAEPEGDKVVLKGFRDMSPHVLAHESVHGQMMQPDGENYLPGENQFENRIYDEFVARLAENEISDLRIDEGMKDDFREARAEYLATRKKYKGEQLSRQFKSLWNDLEQTDRTTDEKIQKEIDQALFPYQELREQVLAAEAAKRYSKEHQYNIKELLKPDEKLYSQTVEYIKQVENDVA
ncbi:MAG: hypothetical protein ABEJ87_01350 [Candidatus Nanohalobium sp.]